MAIEEVDQELWQLATENVTKRQDEAFETLFDQAVDVLGAPEPFCRIDGLEAALAAHRTRRDGTGLASLTVEGA